MKTETPMKSGNIPPTFIGCQTEDRRPPSPIIWSDIYFCGFPTFQNWFMQRMIGLNKKMELTLQLQTLYNLCFETLALTEYHEQAQFNLFKVAAATFRRPLAGISVSRLRFRCFRHWISKFSARERWDFNISSSGASGFQDFQLRSVTISIFPI